jgi:hypothetical protein
MQDDLILKKYLAEVARVRATGAGTGETSYYSALHGALNLVGDTLKPKVTCLSQMSCEGVFPEFGLFTLPQLGRGGVPTSWPSGPVPERGVVEADDIPAELSVKRGSKQVSGYLDAYGQVLLTNFREFELLERGYGDSLLNPHILRLPSRRFVRVRRRSQRASRSRRAQEPGGQPPPAEIGN